MESHSWAISVLILVALMREGSEEYQSRWMAGLSSLNWPFLQIWLNRSTTESMKKSNGHKDVHGVDELGQNQILSCPRLKERPLQIDGWTSVAAERIRPSMNHYSQT